MSPLDVRQLHERDDQADRQIYINALVGARTIDGDNDDDDSDAGERETISFFDQSVIVSPFKRFVADSGFEFSLLREEGQIDVFLSRRSSSAEEDDDWESDWEEDLDDDDDDYGDLLYLT